MIASPVAARVPAPAGPFSAHMSGGISPHHRPLGRTGEHPRADRSMGRCCVNATIRMSVSRRDPLRMKAEGTPNHSDEDNRHLRVMLLLRQTLTRTCVVDCAHELD